MPHAAPNIGVSSVCVPFPSTEFAISLEQGRNKLCSNCLPRHKSQTSRAKSDSVFTADLRQRFRQQCENSLLQVRHGSQTHLKNNSSGDQSTFGFGSIRERSLFNKTILGSIPKKLWSIYTPQSTIHTPCYRRPHIGTPKFSNPPTYSMSKRCTTTLA